MNFTFIDLFCGLGGFRLAMESNGGTCLMSSDIDKAVREVYNLNFGEYPRGNIEEIESADVPVHDVLCAGFPCQPFSIAGKRLGFEDARGTLFFQVARIAKDKQPKIVFLENVAGLKSHDQGKTLETICNIMDDIGYNFYWTLMNAKDYNVPQNRNRWYGVGIRKDLDSSAFRFPTTEPLTNALSDIIRPEGGYGISDLVKGHIEKHLPAYKEKPQYSEDFPLIANEIRPSRCHFSSSGICPCLTAKMGTGGNNIPVVVNQNRTLSERECLQIMGFPESYKLAGTKTQSYKQIGNSVCVSVIETLGKAIVKVLEANSVD